MNTVNVDVFSHQGPLIIDGCGGPIGRAVPDHDTVSLSDYRIRFGLYRTDPNLVANHQNFAWIPTWDDVLYCNSALMIARSSR
jgi:alkaline phosphatase D